jgi:phosphomannomutase
MEKSCFGAYDIRGIYPAQINEQLAYGIGRAFPALIKGKKIAVGRDVRLSGASLRDALVKGLVEAGADVVDIGVVGTEMIYFGVPYLDMDGGIMITASHNPKEYNGMKFVARDSVPLSKELFKALEVQVVEEDFPPVQSGGNFQQADRRTGHG